MLGFIGQIFYVIDSLVFWLVEIVYQLFFAIAKVDLFTLGVGDASTGSQVATTISEFMGRITNLIGIVAVFYLIFIFVQWIADPEKIKSAGSLVTRGVVAVSLLLILNSAIFPFLRMVQTEIVAGNTINRIILGTNETDSSPEMTAKSLARTTFKTFVTLKTENGEPDGKPLASNTCIATYKGIFEKNYALDYNKLNEDDCISEKTGSSYALDYKWLLGSLVGGYMAYLLILFCVDVALRVFELLFLQLIAPAPILSYIVNPQGAFVKWKDALISTYLSLFIRMAIFSFATLLINIIIQSAPEVLKIADGNLLIGSFVLLFLILGIMAFMKKAPQLLSDVLGIKGGGISFNAADRPVLGKAIPLAAGGAMMASKLATGAAGVVGGTAMGVARQTTGLVGAVKGGATMAAASNGNLYQGLQGFIAGGQAGKANFDAKRDAAAQGMTQLGGRISAIPKATSRYAQAMTNGIASGMSLGDATKGASSVFKSDIYNAGIDALANEKEVPTAGSMFSAGAKDIGEGIKSGVGVVKNLAADMAPPKKK